MRSRIIERQTELRFSELIMGDMYYDSDGDVFVYHGGTSATFLGAKSLERPLHVGDIDHSDYAPFHRFTGSVTLTQDA